MDDLWYEDTEKVMELAEFLVESEQLETASDLLDYFEDPEKYTDIWELYQEEILGISPKKPKPFIGEKGPGPLSVITTFAKS